MRVNLTFLLLVCVTFKVLGVLLYLRGFLAVRKSVDGYATFKDQPKTPSQHESTNEQGKPTFGRLVIIMVDALRADFVLPLESSLPRMKFVEALISRNETISFKAKANPPTVTMPRIKALTSGTIPTFVDIVLNVDSKSLTDDNVVTQLHRNGKKIVFYGDDTWLRLFPDHFIRYDGTTSFFVPDYTEVDLNVTRHLDNELESLDWDVMILHYLGLDHIGHLAGPRSPLVPGKLDEMDNIVKRIYDSTVKQDSSRELPTLMLLCGDHGMSEQGSHGGSTPSEVTTPVVLLSSAFREGKGFSFDPGIEVQQIDVTPTLSALLGVPIPQNNLGVVIPSVLDRLPMNDQLGILHSNIQQLSKVFQTNVPNFEKDELYIGAFNRVIKMHENWMEYFNTSAQGNLDLDVDLLGKKVKENYVKVMIAMRDRIAASLTNYDLHSMGVGIALLWMVLVTIVYAFRQIHQGYIEVSLGIHGSFVFLIMFGLLTTAHFIECTGEQRTTHALCNDDLVTYGAVLSVLLASSLFCTETFIKASTFTSGLKAPKSDTAVAAFLSLGTVGHTFSLLSSSFVEEEHQTWYFFTQTALLLILLQNLFDYYKQCKVLERQIEQRRIKELNSNHLENQQHLMHMHCSLYQQLNPANDKTSDTQTSKRQKNVLNSISEELASEKEPMVCPTLKPAYLPVVTLVLCRVCRMWNQTGDKWSHLPDLGDWLVLPENKPILSALTVVALVITVMLRRKDRKSSNILFFLGCVGVYCFRAANGAVDLPFVYDSEELQKGIIEARIVYAVIAMLLIDTVVRCLQVKWSPKKQLQNYSALQLGLHGLQKTWLLLTILCVRPHNISLVSLISLQEVCLKSVMHNMRKSLSATSITLLYLWMGQAAFYYQGNSNSFTTVDVSVGFIGLEESQIALGSLLVLLSTYSGPIFWTISLTKLLVDFSEENSSCAKSRNGSTSTVNLAKNRSKTELSCDILVVCFVFVLTRALPLAVYTVMVTAQRYHLFVWTVFSPKLLYEGLHTVIVIGLVLALLVIKMKV